MAAKPKPVVGPLQQPKKKLNALPKPTPKAGTKAKELNTKKKPAPLKEKKYTRSEQNFLDGQKLKKKILKNTGIYPNTAD
jgi:hypothetical protein